MVEEETYGYKLEYKNNDYTCTVTFRGDIDGEELRYNLKDFLKGCSWSEHCIDQIFNETKEDEEWIED